MIIKFNVLLLSAVLFFACSGRKAINSTTNVFKIKGDSIFIIPASLFLENRVANCDSAIVYMKIVISPGAPDMRLVNSYRIPGESSEFLNACLENESYIIENNKRFYVSAGCLVGQKFKVALDIFIRPEYHSTILKEIDYLEKAGEPTWINLADINMTVEKGYIVSASLGFVVTKMH